MSESKHTEPPEFGNWATTSRSILICPYEYNRLHEYQIPCIMISRGFDTPGIFAYHTDIQNTQAEDATLYLEIIGNTAGKSYFTDDINEKQGILYFYQGQEFLDLLRESETQGQHIKLITSLGKYNLEALFDPKGFAHSFNWLKNR